MNTDKFETRVVWQPAQNAKYLMVILHGRGDSPEGFASFQRELQIVGLSMLLLQAPDDYYGGFSWYDPAPDQLPGIERSRELLTHTFDELIRQGYAPEKTFLFGFSQGCLMTLEFGGRYTHRLAGYLGISGYCYDAETLVKEAFADAKNGDWLITHGTEDEVLPIAETRDQMKVLQAGGFTLEYKEYVKSHTIDHRDELPYIREWIRSRMR
jgi:phospholipase/carboxylesterase